MQTTMIPRTLLQSSRSFALALTAAGTLIMTGCGAGSFGSNVAAPPVKLAFSGHVQGGQQPVAGATIRVYAATQVIYSGNATQLNPVAVFSNANGNFNIAGNYTCPYPTSQIYITAQGGNPGSGTNPNLALMTALGPCSSLSSSSFISINELTTVASAYALSPFMSSSAQVSTTPTNVTGLSNAFATVNKLVNTSSGLMPGPALPAGATEPVAELNTLADILAGCVNSTGGTANDNSACGNLFAATTPPVGPAPTDTITAALNIAKYPGNHAATLFTLMTPSAPFQPTLTAAPAAYTVSLRYAPVGAGAFSTPTAAAIDPAGNVWVTNSGNNTLSVVGAVSGTPIAYTGGGLNQPSAIAFDAMGNAWVANKGNSTLSAFTPAGAGSAALSTNLSSPAGVAIDGQGVIWVTNSASNRVTAVTAAGTTVSESTTYPVGGTTPGAVAINPR